MSSDEFESNGGGAGGPEQDPAKVSLGGADFTWPVPDRTVDVAGRTVPLEIAGVAGVYALVGLIFLWESRGLVNVLPEMLRGLLSGNAILFALAWLATIVALYLLYVVAAFLYIAYTLWRTDPVGRGLAATLFALLALLEIFTGLQSGTLFLVMLVSGLSTAVLFLSPWARRAFAESPQRGDRPGSVILFDTLAVPYWTLNGLITLISLPTLAWFNLVGGRAVFFTITVGVATVLAFLAWRGLRHGPDRQARVLMTGAAGVTLLGGLVAGGGGVMFLFSLTLLAAMVGPLWVASSAREWFGDAPLVR